MNILVLGGTTEASDLALRLAAAHMAATLSLAGRTASPRPSPIPMRIGGFGGVSGLVAYLREHRIGALIDATHPFASQMTRHAIEAAVRTGVPLLAVRRPAWEPVADDLWFRVPDLAAAAAALGHVPLRVLLTVGRKDLAPFVAAPWHRYVVRSVDPPPPETLPLGAEIISARGPFTETDERRLLRERRIETIVTKNSGGTATVAKLAAARALRLPVVMVERPPAPPIPAVADAGAALAWLARLHDEPRTMPRGV